MFNGRGIEHAAHQSSRGNDEKKKGKAGWVDRNPGKRKNGKKK
jgi:hypothetical protein